jgi:hypothetical protein
MRNRPTRRSGRTARTFLRKSTTPRVPARRGSWAPNRFTAHATKLLVGGAALRRSIRIRKAWGRAGVARMARIASSNSVNVYGSMKVSSALERSGKTAHVTGMRHWRTATRVVSSEIPKTFDIRRYATIGAVSAPQRNGRPPLDDDDPSVSVTIKTPARPRAHENSPRGWSETRRNWRVSAVSVAPDAKLLGVLTASTFARRLLRRLTVTRSRCRINALGRSIHVRGKGCAYDHDRFAHRDPSSSFSLVRTQARERGSACPARPIRTPPSGSI